MPFSLYAATIPSYLQMLDAATAVLGKAEAFCAEKGLAPADVLDARLADDMLPFAYQVKSIAVHSLGAIEGVRAGIFAPDMTPPPADFAGLTACLAAARAGLAELDPAEVDGFVGRDMRFEFGSFRLDFTAETFLLSFSQPNFYFHATTTYAILRGKGVPLGKRDFMGRPRTKD